MTQYPHEVLYSWFKKDFKTPTSCWVHVFFVLFAFVAACNEIVWVYMISIYVNENNILRLGYQDFIIFGLEAYFVLTATLTLYSWIALCVSYGGVLNDTS